MNDLVVIFFIVLIPFGLAYFFLVGFFTCGWFRLQKFEPGTPGGKTKVSVIIPSRNEEMNILNILTDLSNQDYSSGLFEIIVIDDNSSDNTSIIVEYFISQVPEKKVRLIRLTEDHPNTAFKKKAIRQAIDISTGDLIITTDADCRLGSHWLKTIICYYETEKSKMVVGPVSFHNEKSVFEKIQTVEFFSLIAITAGAIKMKMPIMCNGANLAYEKNAYYQVGGFGDDAFSSGDDVFLMLKMMKEFGNHSVGFIKNMNAMVYTEAKKNLRDFINQRVRWASKNKGYDLKILSVSFTVYMVNLFIVAGMIIGIFIPYLLKPMSISYLLILLIEIPILLGFGAFVNRTRMMLYSLPLILFYPVYIVVTGALGIVAGYQWKGRTLKQ